MCHGCLPNHKHGLQPLIDWCMQRCAGSAPVTQRHGREPDPVSPQLHDHVHAQKAAEGMRLPCIFYGFRVVSSRNNNHVATVLAAAPRCRRLALIYALQRMPAVTREGGMRSAVASYPLIVRVIRILKSPFRVFFTAAPFKPNGTDARSLFFGNGRFLADFFRVRNIMPSTLSVPRFEQTDDLIRWSCIVGF
jgi:hypothetical protein